MKCLLYANTDWYLYNFRRSLAAGLLSAGYEVLLVSPSGPYGEKLKDLGFRWIPAPMDRSSLNPLRELGLLYWLWRLARSEDVDVVHGFTIKCAVYGGLIARLTGAARISAVAGLGFVFISDRLKARVLRPVVRQLMSLAFSGRRAILILQNDDDLALFEKARLAEPDQIRIIRGSGVDCSRFEVRKNSSDEKPSALKVVLASRMLWDKGIAEFVQAARLLKGQGRKLQFILAGAPDAGNPASIPEAILKNWHDNGVIKWLGHVDNMAALYSDSDIVVLPSYREGLPKSLIEAAACGLPLVTTDVPGCREVVSDGIDGLLVPVRDAPALATAIARLQDDPDLSRRLGLAARAKALAEFDERIIIAKTIDVYREVTAR